MLKDKMITRRLEELNKLEAYRFIATEDISEIACTAVTMEHIKTRARVFLLLNDDDNKVFTIGFRTPSINSTGLAHILEHSVLCGSKKFPSKDPFVELVKGSLNTFLNAMTYPDKTVYPVASTNDKDFHNLMEVYLDSVFYPNVHNEEKIFKQEGWHYELLSKEDELKINGVVYNEMKGVFSSVDGSLERMISKSLFEGHSYGEDSGGDPEFIPQLDYNQFLEYHSTYYHPSNSYIYLYGDMDMSEKLEFIDREYLSKFEYKDIDSAIKDVDVWAKPKEFCYEYPISDEESEEGADYLSVHTVVGGELDPVKYTAFQILDYCLLQVPGAVLKEALIDAKIAKDVSGGYSNGIKEPYFSVIAKQCDISKLPEFKMVVKGTLRKIVDEGLDRQMLRAAINISEFRAREADFGSYPKGLMYGLESFDTWLYDADPTLLLKFENIFVTLREKLDTTFYEDLIRDYLLDNPYEAYVNLIPKKGLAKQREEEVLEKLSAYKASLSDEELEKIIEATKLLKEYQSEPSKQEDIDKIPVLKREDIKKEAKPFVYELKRLPISDIDIVHSDIFSSGISYIKLLFNINHLNRRELKLAQLLTEILGSIDTENYSYANLSTQINLNTGGLSSSLANYTDIRSKEDSFYFVLSSKIMYDKTEALAELLSEISLLSKLSDSKRIKDIVLELRLRLKNRILAQGHVTALNRAMSQISKSALFNDMSRGIEYYKFLEELESKADFELLSKEIIELAAKIFGKNNLLVHISGDMKSYEQLEKLIKLIEQRYPVINSQGVGFVLENTCISEAFSSAATVNYVARVGDFAKAGFEYTGVLKVLKVLLSYDYLWNKVRVLGGAYGCMSHFSRLGLVGLTSYRDPNISKTDETYRKVYEYAKAYKADEREMTKSVIGAISELDTPLTPSLEGARSLAAYLGNISFEDITLEREQILNCSDKDINALSDMLKLALSENIRCVVGNEVKIEEEKSDFDIVNSLYSM